MATIRGLAELMGMDKPIDEAKRKKFSNIIKSQVDRCTSMTEELLCFARGENSFNFECSKVSIYLAQTNRSNI